MNCILKTHEQEELLLGYCTGTLEPDTAKTYERHIAACEDCRVMAELQQLVDETMNQWQAPEVSNDFDRRLFARVRAEETGARAWWQMIFPMQWGWKPLIPVALAGLALVIFLARTPDSATVARQGDVLKSDEIEQVERALDDMEALHALHQSDGDFSMKEAL